MSTRFFFPQSDAVSAGWYLVLGSGALWRNVNDKAGDVAAAASGSTADNLTTSIKYNGDVGAIGNYLAQLVGDLSLTHAAIASVTIRAQVEKIEAGNPRFKLLAQSGTTLATSDLFTDSTTGWYAKTWVLTTDPDTGEAWTPAAVNALQIGIQFNNDYAGMYCSMLEAEVSYTFVNTAPVAADATLDVPYDTPMYGELSATDADDDALTFAIVGQPEHGTIELDSATGAYTFTPDAGYSGEDSFTFTANDGYDDSNTGTITVTVDDAPPANPPTGDYSHTEGCQLLLPDASGISAGAGEEIVAYSWDFGDGTTGTGVTPYHIYAAAGTYTVVCTVRYAGGELFSFSQSITITALDFAAVASGSFALTDASDNTPPAGASITAYAWDWDDAMPADAGVSASHRYLSDGVYTIQLTVTIAGHTITTTKELTIMVDTVTSGLQADTNQHLILDAGAIILHYGEVGLERVLGATRGGTRFTLGRTLREMEVDGAIGPVKGFKRRETVAPVITAPLLDMRVENVLEAIAGGASSEEGATTVITAGEIADADYIANVAMSCRYSGSNDPLILVLKNVLITAPFELATADKNEPVLELTFAAHFDPATPRLESSAWEIIHPQQAASGS